VSDNNIKDIPDTAPVSLGKVHIDKEKLLECLKKEAEFCIKEKFNEKNTRFYLGRESVLTDIIGHIESGKFDYFLAMNGGKQNERSHT
jgi:hypothetical protein